MAEASAVFRNYLEDVGSSYRDSSLCSGIFKTLIYRAMNEEAPYNEMIRTIILDEDWLHAQKWLEISPDGLLSLAESKGSTDE